MQRHNGAAGPATEVEAGTGSDASGFFGTRRAADYFSLSPRTPDGYSVSGDDPARHRFGNRVRCRRTDLVSRRVRRRAPATAEADRLASGARSRTTGAGTAR